MELQQLKNFQVLARYEHMSKAAEALHMAQPTLSKSISRLENELGFSLFDRSGRGIKLNIFGRTLLGRVDTMFSELDAGLKEVSDMRSEAASTVSFSVNLPSIIPYIMKNFSGNCEKVKIHAEIGNSKEMRDALENGKIDFCISTPPIIGDKIETTILIKEEIFLAVSKDHPLAKKKSVRLKDLKSESFIAFSDSYNFRNQTDKFCNDAGFTPNIILEADAATMSRELIELNVGISLLPKPHFWEEHSDEKIKYIPIENPVCQREVGISRRKNSTSSLCVRHFTDYIIKVLSEES